MMNLGFTFFILVVASVPAYGAKLFTRQNSGFNCERILSPNIEVINSGKISTEMMEQLTEAVDEIFGPQGALKKLGISSPQQKIEFMSGADLNLISTLNRYPVGHWHDGAQLAGRSAGGAVYEIVIPGRESRHSLYRDDNPFAHNVSILMHVAGHTHFGVHNRWRQTRTADLIQEAYDLDSYLDQAKRSVNPDEVNRWYQYLLTLAWSQDILNATSVDNVDELKAKPSKNDATLQVARTSNILQTYIANFPKDWPEWKHEIARRFERLQRYIPGAIRTKIMNEGFATILMEILPKHTSYRSFTFGMESCCLLSNVLTPKLSNPYWLGVEAYRHMYERFKTGFYTEAYLRKYGFGTIEPQIPVRGLDAIEIDRAYIEWVTRNVIEIMDDTGFLQFAFADGEWLAKQNLAVMRPASDQQEFDPNLPRTQDPEMNWQWLIDSREPAAVIKAIIAEVKGFEYQFPNIEITDLNENRSGIIRLEISDPIGRQVPLNTRSIVETLYVHSQINERPVAIESTVEFVSLEPVDQQHRGRSFERETTWKLVNGEYKEFYVVRGLKRVKTVVFPSGDIETYRVLRDGDDSPSSLPQSLLFPEEKKIELVREAELEKNFKKLLAGFVANLNLEDMEFGPDSSQKGFRNSTMSRLEKHLLSATAGPTVDMQLAVPTAGKALHEYESYVKRRMQQAMKRAIYSPGGVSIQGGQIAIQALPSIPQFSFNSKAMQAYRTSQGLAQNTGLVLSGDSLTYMQIFKGQELKRVVPIPGRTGERRWGPNPNQDDGDGEEGDETEEGDEDGDKPARGRKPGKSEGDLSWVDISLDDWAKALEDVVELPNLRPKGDKSRSESEEKGGKVFKRHGTAVNREIIRKAYKKGLAQTLIEEDEDDDQTPPGIIRRGLGLLNERDWAVRGWQPVKEPEISAQVTMIMDLSGSMGDKVPTMKRMFFDLRAILMRKYKKIEFRFISFDSEAHVFDNFDDFIRSKLGGGTSYVRALEKDLEVKKQFPPDKFDRFTAVIGDMEDHAGAEFQQALENVIAESQFVTAITLNDRTDSFGLGTFFKELHEREPYFGHAEVIPTESYRPVIFRKAFKNPER
jgi:uncharacterized sporulation protein YeaH/YhbH (DUF444 family)